jgi:hypothetical protein
MYFGYIAPCSGKLRPRRASTRKLTALVALQSRGLPSQLSRMSSGWHSELFSINAIRMNTYKKSPYNPSAINTYKNARLKVVQNEHLRKNRGGRGWQSQPRAEVDGLQASARGALGAKVPGKRSFRGVQVKSSSFGGKKVGDKRPETFGGSVGAGFQALHQRTEKEGDYACCAHEQSYVAEQGAGR